MTARRWLLPLVVVLPLLLPSAASAETVVEAWRSPFGQFDYAYCVSANAADGSCWVADRGHNQIVHLAQDGSDLSRSDGFTVPYRVSASPADGSCWVADTEANAVAHLAADGHEMWRGGGYAEPSFVAVNPSDGSCWVADWGNQQVVHLANTGAELWRGGGFSYPWSVAANRQDGSCWVTVLGEWDGTTWVNSSVVHLSAGHAVLSDTAGFSAPSCVSVNTADGSCWVAENGSGQVVHLGADGKELRRSAASASYPESVSVNANDGSCWVSLYGEDGQVVHYSADGTELWRGAGFRYPVGISVDATDGSCWVADTLNNRVVHLSIALSFTDVPHHHWARLQIEACVAAAIVQGYPDGLYHPEWPVTRDQMAVYIARGLVAPSGDAAIPSGPTVATFPDVPSSHWAYKWIEYCHDQGVVQGYWDGYHPDEVVNRAQMAVFVARAIVAPSGDAAIPDPMPPATFPDVLPDYWAWKWVEYCHGEGVVQGYWDGYRPEEVVNRAQMAVYVQRAFELPL